MPAGLGIHPYFPRTAGTRYRGMHRGEWTTGSDGLPLSLEDSDRARDWGNGRPVGSRIVDTLYSGREGALTIDLPESALRVTMQPSPNLPCTAVYVPDSSDFFCVEPVSHATNAVNSMVRGGDMVWLEPQDWLEARVDLSVVALPG
jgi:aldose 1-epimerase